MHVDYKLLNNVASLSDFQRAQEEFDLKKQLAQAQVESEKKKLTQIDVDKLGEQAFMKAAMGQGLTPEEQAAAMFIDAKSGGTSFNPVTGEIIQKQRISDKIGLPGVAPQPPSNAPYSGPVNNDFSSIPPMNPELLNGSGGYPAMGSIPIPPRGGADSMTPKAKQALTETNIKADRARLDEIITGANSAGAAKSSAARMSELQGRLGYTGTGAGALADADKVLSVFGGGGLIKGDPAAREAFSKEGVESWVKAVEPLKGALTEKEGFRFDKAIPSLSMTPEGIKMMNDLTLALGQRAQDKSQFYQEYFNQNGNLAGADSLWQDYADQNPVIPESFGGPVDNDVQSIIDRYAQ